MRIIFLNSWYAKAGSSFYEFIKKNSSETDIFCLNEVYPEMFSKIGKLLVGFDGFYEKGKFDSIMHFNYGQAFFFKQGVGAKSSGRFSVFRNVYNDVGYVVPFHLQVNEENSLYIVNVHGKARPGHKLDTPARIRQSQKILDFLKDKNSPKIVGGDFNLMPQTRSVKMFEKEGYRNLIKEFGIRSTRNSLTWKQFPNDEKQYFADYIFTSPEILIKNFQVPDLEVSDHLPLILDFEI